MQRNRALDQADWVAWSASGDA